jgi:hypothetical protein
VSTDLDLTVAALRAANSNRAEPGDTIVFAFNRAMSAEEIDHILTSLRDGIHADIAICVVDQVQSATVVKG